MLVAFDQKFAFLAMARCASTSIEAALAPHCDIVCSGASKSKHAPFSVFKRYFAPYAALRSGAPIQTVCLFREPVSWLHSWYAYRQRPALIGHKNSTRGLSFEEFISAYVLEHPPSFADIGNQTDFVHDHSGKVGVDTIFRFDAIGAFQNHIQDVFLKPFEFAHLNKAPAADVALSASGRAAVERKLSRAFEIYEGAISG